MAKNNANPEAAASDNPQVQELVAVEILAARHDIPDWTMAGLKTAMSWGDGKELTDQEFIDAVNTWLSGPIQREV